MYIIRYFFYILWLCEMITSCIHNVRKTRFAHVVTNSAEMQLKNIRVIYL